MAAHFSSSDQLIPNQMSSDNQRNLFGRGRDVIMVYHVILETAVRICTFDVQYNFVIGNG
jgi:hypothetical protein